MRNIWRVTVLFAALLVPWTYTNCRVVEKPSPTSQSKGYFDPQGTNTGNPKPTDACPQILEATCTVLIKAFPELNAESCQAGLLSTSLINKLGVPTNVLNPYYNLCSAEESSAVRANESQLPLCLNAIRNLSPNAPEVLAAYNKSLFNPFAGAMNMIPSGPNQCGEIFKDNQFELPNPPVEQPGIVVVNFDNPWPGPLLTVKPLAGLYEGIEFTEGVWGWELPFDASSTNFAVNYGSTTGDTGFSFSGGPKTLLSFKVFASNEEVVLTVYDDQGQSIKQTIPADKKMHLVTTHFRKPSHHIYFNKETSAADPYRSAGLGLDDITYQLPATQPVIAQVQSQFAVWDKTLSKISIGFNSQNEEGNLIVALVVWKGTGRLQSVSDSAGNIYEPAAAIASTPSGQHQQIWIAKNIKAAQNSVSAHFINANEIGHLYLQEYRGVAVTNPIDVIHTVSGYGQELSSGNFTTRSSSQLIYAAILSDWSGVMLDSDYVIRPYFGLTPLADRIITEAGAYKVTGMLPVPTNWVVQVISFKSREL